MGKKNVTVGVRVDEELDQLLKSIAKKEDRTVSYIARELIVEGLKVKGILKK
ncbi:ribbon-helix-helix domain-containing protein [Puniceicoccaceae bacterium K14]|nr:ribbon-helix-helix domain-containing protein [Puniceicoccaceae bacterium K14]